ncbi:Uncharacterised protein [Mannheimia haemolytica]|uniref:Uncharacterized protein n=1 Tax=Mannheimia haemolytica TaxID=75985 RepID=A0A378N9Y8_MANHA|nr:Uncharacterised protein [Mannheimia haemolytica]
MKKIALIGFTTAMLGLAHCYHKKALAYLCR